jgi:Zn-dependent protease
VLNLLPLDPLDGGQALKLLGNKNQERFQLVFSFISSLIMIGIGWYFEFWIVVIFGFIMGLRVRSIQKNLHIHNELTIRGVDYVKNYKSLTNREFSIIKEVVVK